MDTEVVCGSLLCNRETSSGETVPIDLAPTILAHYDVRRPETMRGEPILRGT